MKLVVVLPHMHEVGRSAATHACAAAAIAAWPSVVHTWKGLRNGMLCCRMLLGAGGSHIAT